MVVQFGVIWNVQTQSGGWKNPRVSLVCLLRIDFYREEVLNDNFTFTGK